MLIEHILYNLAVAILVGILYIKYKGRNPSWIIVASAWILDIDYLIQFVCYDIVYNNTKIVLPLMIRHGDFHNIFMIVILSIIFGWVCVKYFNENIYDAMICIGIGGSVHYICDIMVYDNWYNLFYPFGDSLSRGFAILPETRNIFGIGDWTILTVGLGMLIWVCLLKFSIDGLDSLHYIDNKVKEMQMVCLVIIGSKLGWDSDDNV